MYYTARGNKTKMFLHSVRKYLGYERIPKA